MTALVINKAVEDFVMINYIIVIAEEIIGDQLFLQCVCQLKCSLYSVPKHWLMQKEILKSKSVFQPHGNLNHLLAMSNLIIRTLFKLVLILVTLQP